MTSLEFFEVFSEIDDKYIVEAADKGTNKNKKTKSKKSIYKWWIAAAPVVAAAVVAGIVIIVSLNTNMISKNDSTSAPVEALTCTESVASDSTNSYGIVASGPQSDEGDYAYNDTADAETSGCEDASEYNSLIWVESYSEGSTDNGLYIVSPKDMAVDNGTVELSASLKAAVEEYGSDAVYRVVITLYKDGVTVDSSEFEGEASRLYAEGYTVAVEERNDGNVVMSYLTIHTTLDQLAEFSADEGYGYYLALYGEIFEVEWFPSSYN